MGVGGGSISVQGGRLPWNMLGYAGSSQECQATREGYGQRHISFISSLHFMIGNNSSILLLL